MKLSSVRDTKHAALLVAVALLSPALMPQSAQAVDLKDEKTLKTGAAVLGAVGAYYVAKGKTLKGVLAGAAGYYAYKKSKEVENERTSGEIYPDDVYTSTRNDGSGYAYPDEIGQDVSNDGTIYDDGVYEDGVFNDTYPNGRNASTRDERREERRAERQAQRRENRNNETYSEDFGYDEPGYLELNKKSASPSNSKTEETVLQ